MSPPAAPRPTRIVVVEDEAIVALDLQDQLEAAGYAVVGVASAGTEAVELATRVRPDLVLMDVTLSDGETGVGAAAEIGARLGLPVVFATAHVNDELLDKIKGTDPFGYLVKPIEPRELYVTIELALHKARVSAALRESELRFRTVADFTADWEGWVRPDGTYEWVSPSCEAITGYPPSRFHEQPGLMLQMIHPDDRELWRTHDLGAGPPRELEFRIRTASGEERWIWHRCQEVFDAEGRCLGRRGSNRDVTLRKHHELELQRALDRVRTLRGMLPICAACKRIRKDDGYWQQIELYVREHSDAEFSHGLCPECSKVYFPDL